MKEHVQRVHTEKAVQLELSETVDSSFPDDFDLPVIETYSAPNKKPKEVKIKAKRDTNPDKRLKTLLPKETVK